jgi:hypothetical protein
MKHGDDRDNRRRRTMRRPARAWLSRDSPSDLHGKLPVWQSSPLRGHALAEPHRCAPRDPAPATPASDGDAAAAGFSPKGGQGPATHVRLASLAQWNLHAVAFHRPAVLGSRRRSPLRSSCRRPTRSNRGGLLAPPPPARIPCPTIARTRARTISPGVSPDAGRRPAVHGRRGAAARPVSFFRAGGPRDPESGPITLFRPPAATRASSSRPDRRDLHPRLSDRRAPRGPRAMRIPERCREQDDTPWHLLQSSRIRPQPSRLRVRSGSGREDVRHVCGIGSSVSFGAPGPPNDVLDSGNSRAGPPRGD